MSVRVVCAHCQTPCLVAGRHVNQLVKCARCGRAFTAKAAPAPPPPLPAAPKTPVTGPRLDVGGATSPGRVRPRNEDSFLLQHVAWSTLDGFHELALLAVADGMGGHEAGQEAGGLVVQTIGRAMAPLLAGAQTGELIGVTPDILKGEVASALQEANRVVHRRGRKDAAVKGLGATAALALIWDGHALIGHAGDCRVYHLRGGKLTQVTRDHTLVARMVELGQLTPREAESHPRRNEVTQAVGRQSELKPDLHHLELTTGDWLVLACDGLHADLDEKTLQEELLKPAPSAARRARRLVELANERGGSDNCTVLAACCG